MKKEKPHPVSKRAAGFSAVMVGIAALLPVSSLSAFTADNAATAVSAYNNAFYVGNNGKAYYKKSTSDANSTYFWVAAEQIEMMMDAHNMTGNANYKNVAIALVSGFIDKNGTDWSYNIYNDDIMWACIAFIRVGETFGVSDYVKIAKSNFDMAYSRAWDSKLGGGLWWTTEKKSKNAVVSGTAAIVAYRLYKYYGTASYGTKAKDILNWQKSKLYESSTGKIYDRIRADGLVTTDATSYNQGLFMGACYYMGDSQNAIKAGNWAKNKWGTTMPVYDRGGNNGGLNGICLRWMRFVGYDAQFRRDVANIAWSKRRTTNNLCWNAWNQKTPSTGVLYSWDCSSMVCALMNANPG
jgi:predicted alpha-1,6-mannanase (GH76 family)